MLSLPSHPRHEDPAFRLPPSSRKNYFVNGRKSLLAYCTDPSHYSASVRNAYRVQPRRHGRKKQYHAGNAQCVGAISRRGQERSASTSRRGPARGGGAQCVGAITRRDQPGGGGVKRSAPTQSVGVSSPRGGRTVRQRNQSTRPARGEEKGGAQCVGAISQCDQRGERRRASAR